MLSVVEYRRVLREITVASMSDLDILLRQASDGVVAREILEAALPDLVNTYGSAAASVSADWYEDVRVASGAPGRFRVRAPNAVPAEQARILARWGVEPLFSKTPDWLTALQLLDGGVQRLITNQARKAVMDSAREDAAAQGWRRMAGGDACGFCKMLADRGAVYSKDTVDFGAHDSCGCVAVPEFGGDVLGMKRFVRSTRGIPESDRVRAKAWMREHGYL